MATSNRLVLPLLDAAQAQKHVTHNEALTALDAVVHLSATSRNVTAPPVSPVEGACVLVATGVTGGFAGHDGAFAAFDNGGWAFFAPRAGWLLHVADENALLIFDGSAWKDVGLAIHALQNLTGLGVGTTSDAANPFAAKLNAGVFTARTIGEGGTGDLRLALNKSAASNTGSLVYQTNFSGRAEAGLTGADDFAIKVSADGATWRQGLTINAATGVVNFPSGTGVGIARLISGAGAPTAPANAGDFWIDTTNSRLYGPFVGPSWPTGYVSLVGTAGPAAWSSAGVWTASTSYTASAPASVVTFAGNSYVCTTSHTSAANFDPAKWSLIAQGGANGATGPAPWQVPPVAWAASTAYTATPPASCVMFGGNTFVCTTAHTSAATFDASKWTLVAASSVGTSTSTISIGTGTLNFTTQAGLAYFVGQRLRAAADAGDWIEGVVTAYAGTTLTLNADLSAGGGSYASWSIGPAGARGATGVTGASSAAVDARTSTARAIVEIRDAAGSLLEGLTSDGRHAKSLYTRRPRHYARADAAGFSQIFVGDRFGETQLTFAGSNHSPELLRGGIIAFTSTRRGRSEIWLMNEDGSNQTAAGTIVAEHWQIVGQSNGLGTAYQASEMVAFTTTNATPGAYMFAQARHSPRTHIDTLVTNVDWTLRVDQVTGIEPLAESAYQMTSPSPGLFAETPCSGFAAQYMKSADGTQRLLVDTHARGSAPWKSPSASPDSYIAPGSAHFANGQILQRLGRKYIEAQGWGYLWAGLLDFHGEADATTAQGTTAAQYTQYQKDKLAAYCGMSKTPSRFHRRRRMYTRQASESAGTGYPNGFSIACANAQAALDEPRIVCFAAAYPYPFCGDNVHALNTANRLLGEQAGKWARRIEKEGFVHKPFVFTSAQRVSTSPSVVRLTFNVPVGALVLDTTTYAQRGNYGFEYSDTNGSGLTITAVALTSGATNQIDITLSGDPLAQTAPVIAYARTAKATGWSGAVSGNGAYGNLRDSDSEIGALSGTTLRNWALHWQAGITA